MVKEMKGDVLACGADVVCHQVNCKGVMGRGLATQIRDHLWKGEYEIYQQRCFERGAANLGTVLYSFATDKLNKNIIVANCFGQDSYGTDSRKTDYDALRACFEDVDAHAFRQGLIVAIPKNIGCGLAGGDWTVVEKMIHETFDNSPTRALIVEYPTQLERQHGAVELIDIINPYNKKQDDGDGDGGGDGAAAAFEYVPEPPVRERPKRKQEPTPVPISQPVEPEPPVYERPKKKQRRRFIEPLPGLDDPEPGYDDDEPEMDF